jgi:predicted permease
MWCSPGVGDKGGQWKVNMIKVHFTYVWSYLKRNSLHPPQKENPSTCDVTVSRESFQMPLFYFILFYFIWSRVSLCRPSCPWTLYADQTSPELTEIHLPLLPSMLGLKAYATTSFYRLIFTLSSHSWLAVYVWLNSITIIFTRTPQAPFAKCTAPRTEGLGGWRNSSPR